MMKWWAALIVVLLLLPSSGIAGGKPDLGKQLVVAAQLGDVNLVKSLLDKGAPVDARPLNDWTPLMSAASGRRWRRTPAIPGLDEKTVLFRDPDKSSLTGRIEVAKLLLEKGAEVNAKDKDGRTALTEASRAGNTDVVKLLLARGVEVNAHDKFGRTALIEASNEGNLLVAGLLIEKGAEVNAKDKDGRTPLIEAAGGLLSDVVKVLLDKGAYVNAKATDGETALIGAASYLRHQAWRLPNYRRVGCDASSRTAFADGAWKRRGEVVGLLRGHGAEVTLTVAALLGDTEEVQRLLERGADVNDRVMDGLTPMMGAAAQGHAVVVTVLKHGGADLDAKDQRGVTALMKAADAGHEVVVRLLLDYGCEVNAKDDVRGRTALIFAAFQGHYRVVDLLLDEGADINAADNAGWTALRWTRNADGGVGAFMQPTAELLKARGAKE